MIVREYETWEVIKMLSENKKLQFKKGRDYLYCSDNGYIYFKRIDMHGKEMPHSCAGGMFDGNVSINSKWQLVRQPVTWQEAIQAWNDGKTISCECCQGHLDGNCGDCRLNAQVFEGKKDCLPGAICKAQFVTGTWYIDGEA